MKLIDKILCIIAFVIFVGMLVCEFIPLTDVTRIIIGAIAGAYFLGCLIYFEVRKYIKKKNIKN